MRWKIFLSYKGTSYAGWQRQPGDLTVQQVLEEAFSTILREPISLIGCGRTDAGVHAREYVAHFDTLSSFDPEKTCYHVNAILPRDIAVHHCEETHPEFHARYDAKERHYRYYLHFHKDPFLISQSYYFHQHKVLDQEFMKQASSLLLQYKHFKPFCKTGSDAENFACKLFESSWTFEPGGAIYSIKANRFLRGMVRLIVGACLNVGLGKITLDELKHAMELQQEVAHAWSVPAEGLFLESVKYGESNSRNFKSE